MATTTTPSSTSAAAANANELPAAGGSTVVGQDTPVEMNDLQRPAQQAQLPQSETSAPTPSSNPPQQATSLNPPNDPSAATAPVSSAPLQSDAPPAAPPVDGPSDSPGIAPAETSTATSQQAPPPVVAITLLLTNGARHPYKIDEKYLRKRNIDVEDMDPFNISVFTLKELIWRDWRDDWEQKPLSPGSIRLIHFGRMLDDKSPLRECRFNAESPNVVHMTVKPQEMTEDEEQHTKGGKAGRSGSDGEERTAGCRCVIL